MCSMVEMETVPPGDITMTIVEVRARDGFVCQASIASPLPLILSSRYPCDDANVVNVIMPPPKYHLPPKTLSVGSLRNVCGVGSIGMAMLWA